MGTFGDALLCVWAHPDDETYLSAGIMAQAVRDGARVVCATATLGEAGSMDEARWPASRMAELRESELRAALAVLGVGELHVLGYRDGACADVPLEDGAASVARLIEDVGPALVLTFGPEGLTGHPDHCAVSRWTARAFEAVAPAGARLLYPTVTPDWGERFLPALEPYDVYAPGTPVVTPHDDLALAFELGDELLDLKLEALFRHESQVQGIFADGLGVDFFRRALALEMYRASGVSPRAAVTRG